MRPNPIPPWDRHPNSAQVQTLTGAGAINLAVDTTYLDQDAAPGVGDHYAVTLPDGNYRGQVHSLFVPATKETTTATFVVSGSLVGCESIVFNTAAHNATLQWDGDGWHMVGGSATTI